MWARVWDTMKTGTQWGKLLEGQEEGITEGETSALQEFPYLTINSISTI